MASPVVGMTWAGDLVARSAGRGENALKYMRMLAEAGLTPALVTPANAAGVVDRLDALLLPGGPDIAPARYGEEPGDRLGAVDPVLDALELEVFAAARARNLPVLGICRGHQMVNVALGGTLHQHVEHPLWDGDPGAPVHRVTITPGSRLHGMLGVDHANVNSGHHQAVATVAPGMRAAACSEDGWVEAIESPDQPVLAVQWHPEEMPADSVSRHLLAGFAELVRATA